MDYELGILVPIAFFAYLFGTEAYKRSLLQRRREMIHRERLAAIEKGLPLPPEEPAGMDGSTPGPRNYLLRGLVWLFLGAGLFTAVLLTSMFAEPDDRPIIARFFFAGLVPAGVGIAYLIFYSVEVLSPAKRAQ